MGGLPLPAPRGVYAGNEPLRRCFFIAGRAVYLPRKEKSGNRLGFQCDVRLVRNNVIVLHSVAVAHNLRVAQSGYGAQHSCLHVLRQAGVRPLHVHFMGREALGLEE